MIRTLATKFERLASPLLAKILYPPTASNTVCRHENKILVLDTGKRYRFPGGMIKALEHPSEAAKREFKEETGMEADIKELISIETYFDGITGLQFFYNAELNGNFEQKPGNWEGKPKLVPKEELSEEMQKVIGHQETKN